MTKEETTENFVAVVVLTCLSIIYLYILTTPDKQPIVPFLQRRFVIPEDTEATFEKFLNTYGVDRDEEGLEGQEGKMTSTSNLRDILTSTSANMNIHLMSRLISSSAKRVGSQSAQRRTTSTCGCMATLTKNSPPPHHRRLLCICGLSRWSPCTVIAGMVDT